MGFTHIYFLRDSERACMYTAQRAPSSDDNKIGLLLVENV